MIENSRTYGKGRRIADMNPAQAYTIMFFTGGFLYCALEILMRGYSHISMLLAGGICFVLVGAVQNLLGGQASLVGQMLLCSLMITVVEFVVGMIVNRYLHLAVWDYSGQQYNFRGQICLLYCNLWFWLSGPVIVLHDLMEHFLLNVPMQHYKIF